MENDIIKERFAGERQLNFDDEDSRPIHVSISQFSGIEINDFAVTVAKTALWIAEAQMLRETESLVDVQVDFLPIHTSARIVEGNALRLNWLTLEGGGDVLAGPLFAHPSSASAQPYDYIIGNPPFAGRRYRTPEQIKDVAQFFGYKDIDYVACWYKKAADLIQGTNTRCAFVSTNSITQGEQVVALWKPIFKQGIHIDFAYRTFRWDSESTQKAHVHCVIIGFSTTPNDQPKMIYDGETTIEAKNINGYLVDAENVFIDNRSKPICNVPKMKNGNVPLDGDSLKIEASEIGDFKDCMQYVKRLMGGRELIRNEKRYVLWLVGVAPDVIRKHPQIYHRVKLCRERRLAMKDVGTRKLADTPTIFRDTNNPKSYIALPMVSSERRKYLPMAYLDASVIPTNQIQTIPSASLYHFGVLTSRVHMAWMRAVCGRLKSDYRYSKDIVYNNFPWPEVTAEQESLIVRTAQAILDARALFPDASLADLYDTLTMPPALLQAHQANDRAVCRLYGLEPAASEPDIVAHLMNRYQALSRGTEPGVSDV